MPRKEVSAALVSRVLSPFRRADLLSLRSARFASPGLYGAAGRGPPGHSRIVSEPAAGCVFDSSGVPERNSGEAAASVLSALWDVVGRVVRAVIRIS